MFDESWRAATLARVVSDDVDTGRRSSIKQQRPATSQAVRTHSGNPSLRSSSVASVDVTGFLQSTLGDDYFSVEESTGEPQWDEQPAFTVPSLMTRKPTPVVKPGGRSRENGGDKTARSIGSTSVDKRAHRVSAPVLSTFGVPTPTVTAESRRASLRAEHTLHGGAVPSNGTARRRSTATSSNPPALDVTAGSSGRRGTHRSSLSSLSSLNDSLTDMGSTTTAGLRGILSLRAGNNNCSNS
jgi:hypothetical protein